MTSKKGKIEVKIMKLRMHFFYSAVAATGIVIAAVATASAETCTLEIKRLESRSYSNPTDYIYRATSSQYINAQIRSSGKNQISFGGEKEREATFKKIVTKEPKYESDHPLRGIAKFGNQDYAFVLDEVDSGGGKESRRREKSRS